jgi:hypothetical protein
MSRPPFSLSPVGLPSPDASYRGLKFGQVVQIYFDSDSVLVRSEVAYQVVQALQQAQTPNPAALNSDTAAAVTQRGNDVASPSAARVLTRYHGSVTLDPQRVNREVNTIVDEIIQRLTSQPGTVVEITLEISAQREAGFDESTTRTISENSRTLKFKAHGFEQ